MLTELVNVLLTLTLTVYGMVDGWVLVIDVFVITANVYFDRFITASPPRPTRLGSRSESPADPGA